MQFLDFNHLSFLESIFFIEQLEIKCSSNKDLDECKYYLYLNIIDKNKNIYKKTHYLLLDFLYSNRAPGDAYIIFREMVKQNMSAYYLTERNDIYQEYYDNKTKFQKIIPIISTKINSK